MLLYLKVYLEFLVCYKRDVLRYLVFEMPSYIYYQYEYENSTDNLYLYQEVNSRLTGQIKILNIYYRSFCH